MAKKPSQDDAANTNSGQEADQKGSGADAAPAGGETPPEAGAPEAGGPGEQPIMVNAQYTKDLSFEAPGAPMIFGLMGEEAPDISVSVNVDANPLQAKTFEVVLSIQAQCKIKDQVGFILELVYAGVFTLNVPDEHLQPVLLIECPRLLFPFARNILADVSRDGGFPPLMLGPVDFVSMFQNQLRDMAEAVGGDGGVEAPEPAN